MRLKRCVFLLIMGGLVCSGQLTMDQKISDFQYVASVYAKRYGPYEWKRDVIASGPRWLPDEVEPPAGIERGQGKVLVRIVARERSR